MKKSSKKIQGKEYISRLEEDLLLALTKVAKLETEVLPPLQKKFRNTTEYLVQMYDNYLLLEETCKLSGKVPPELKCREQVVRIYSMEKATAEEKKRKEEEERQRLEEIERQKREEEEEKRRKEEEEANRKKKEEEEKRAKEEQEMKDRKSDDAISNKIIQEVKKILYSFLEGFFSK